MKRRILFIFFLAGFLISSFSLASFAETVSKEEEFDAWRQIKHDFDYVIGAGSRMDGKSYIAATALLGTAGYMYAEKDKMRKWYQSNRTNSTDDISDVVKPMGNWYVAAGLTTTVYLGGVLFKSNREKETGFMLAESLVYTGALVSLGQLIFAEDRPDEGGDIHFFKSGGHGISGHAAVAAALAGPINKQYLGINKDETNLSKTLKYTGKFIVYTAPLLTSWSRVNDDDHFAWNCLLGSAIGYTMGELIANAHRKSEESKLALAPLIDEKTAGITVSYRF